MKLDFTDGTINKKGKYAQNLGARKLKSDITIITVAFNVDLPPVENFLKSLREQDYVQPEIIICDLGSLNIKALKRLAKKYDAKVLERRYEGNFEVYNGFNKCAGLNWAAEEVDSEYLVVLDIDQVVSENFIRGMGLALDEDRIVFSKVGDIQNENAIKEGKIEKMIDSIKIRDDDKKYDYGACVGISKEWFKKLRGWNITMPIRGHGREFYQRAIAKELEEVWIDNLITVGHQPHKNRCKPLDNFEEIVRDRKRRLDWAKNEMKAHKRIKTKTYHWLDREHNEWIKDQNIFLPDKKEADITVIIPFRDRSKKELRKTIATIPDNIEVIISDYGSIDPPEEAEIIFPRRPVWNRSRCLNEAIKKVKTDYAMTLDSNMLTGEEYFDMVKRFIAPNRALITTITQQNKDGTKEYYPEGTGIAVYPTKFLKRVKGFDERLKGWGEEDDDMFLRAEEAGLEVMDIGGLADPERLPQPIKISPDQQIFLKENRKIREKSKSIVRNKKGIGMYKKLHYKMDLLFLAIDGIDWDYAEKYLKKKIKENNAGKIDSMPIKGEVYSGACWTSIYTGLKPKEHGHTGTEVGNWSWEGTETWLEEADSIGIMDLPITYPAKEVNGWMIAGWPQVGDRDTYNIEKPKGYINDITDIGNYDWRSWKKNDIKRIALQRPMFFKDLLEKKPARIGCLGFTILDRLQHMRMDKSGYKVIDRILKQIDKLFRYDKFIIVADHGFKDKVKENGHGQHDEKGSYITNIKDFNPKNVAEVGKEMYKVIERINKENNAAKEE